MIEEILSAAAASTAELFDIPMKGKFLPEINLSVENVQDTGGNLYEFAVLEAYVRRRQNETASKILWGGYLEHRSIYSSSPLFEEERFPRNIHLGLDFWTDAGTAVHAPMAGILHSFQDNAAFKDYGPTIILRHEFQGIVFHTLYGHLSRPSLAALEVGQMIQKGQKIGWLGAPHENGEWPPHLHFQIILDMQGRSGDYPGVCASAELEHYTRNCPNPRLLLGF
jgi:murein DD-endopeptidase MepM/ murein hydrolase activator NlpD